ncbi:putative ATP-dependent RNA helicase DHR1 [Thecaphora frezii]
MPPPVRTRYNAKARKSSAGGSSHKQKKPSSSASQSTSSVSDSNVPVIVPGSDEDKRRLEQAEQERKRRELLLLSGQDSNAPMSSKKRKRLDAYIASRLKKQERVQLLAKLAQTSKEVDRTELKSAATLGTGRAKTGLERIELAGKKESYTGTRGRKRRRAMYQPEEDDLDADLDGDDGDASFYSPPEEVDGDDGGPVGEVEEDAERRARIMAAASAFSKPATNGAAASTSQVGSALARGPDGQPLMPTIKKRTRKKKKQVGRLPGSGTSWGRNVASASAASAAKGEQDSDSSFDSSESSADEEENESKKKAIQPAPSSNADKKGKAVRWDQDVSGDEAKDIEEDSDEKDGLEQGSSSDEKEVDHEDMDSDSDEEAVLLEAMRLRGLLPDGTKAEGSSSRIAQKETPASPPYDGFPEEGEQDDDEDSSDSDSSSDSDEESGSDESGSEEDSDESGSEDDEDNDDEEEEDEEEDQPRSRRRGIGQSARSKGFKDWARSALGAAGSAVTGKPIQEGEAAEDDESYNLEPVGGYKVRVGDLGPNDGVARGPLGRDEVLPQNKSAFAAKFYAELQETIDGDQAEPKPATAKACKIRHVEVKRDEELVAARLRLPVVAEEETIVRTIMENPVTVICGETGSGKTTQVPQFLYEAGFGNKDSFNPGMIGITQPRRVAAVSMAQRVAKELSLPETKVSHQIRYDATVSPHTAVKFMTDGVLLRELATDFLLTKYSAILVDEAHERSVNTDVLIGVLSRVVRLREQRWLDGTPDARPLRLIIMSATLRVSDFTHNTTLFATPPPVINIDARQHPVTVHFNRRTVQDYLAEAVKKATKIHARLPPGGILIFLTGQQEISTVCRRLEKRFGRKAIEERKRQRQRAEQHRRARQDAQEGEEDNVEDDDKGDAQEGDWVRLAAKDGDVEAEELDLGISKDLALDVDDGAMDDEADADPDALDTDDEADGACHDDHLPAELRDDTDVPMHILPLYSLLPSDKQMRIFAEPPADSRLVVVATNVAETSLTIPNIKYVVDCGRGKERKYDLQSGVQSYEVCWISKASAAQRAGRAGRTGPGHCYRLYSSAVYEDHFHQFSSPEILRTPVEGLVLSMKAMNIDNVANFPFPTPPDRSTIRKAEKLLTYLGALEEHEGVAADTGRRTTHARITELGRSMTLFPVSPRFGKLLAQGQQGGCLPYMIALVAALSVGDPFVREQVLDDHDDDNGDDDAQAKRSDGAELDFGAKEGDETLAPELANLTNAAQLAKERRKANRARYFATMRRFEALGKGLSDTFRLLSVVGAYEYQGGGTSFCERHFLRPKAMEEIHKLRAQLGNLVAANVPRLASTLLDPRLTPPSEKQLKMIRQLLVSAYIDQVAVRADLVMNATTTSATLAADDARTSQALWRLRTAGGGDQMSSTRNVPYKAMGLGGFAYIHPSSTFYHGSPPDWVIFGEIQRSQAKVARVDASDAPTGTVWLKTLTKVNPAWLPTLGRALCSFSKPVEVPTSGGGASALTASMRALKQATGSGGGGAAESAAKREVLLTPTYAVGSESDGMAGGLGWELPTIKATQTLVKGRWVTNF